MRLVWKIAAGIILAIVLLVAGCAGCSMLALTGFNEVEKQREAETRRASAEMLKQVQAAAEGFTQGVRGRAVSPVPAPRKVLVDVVPLAADQSCVNGVVMFIDRSVPGSAVARPFLENGQQAACQGRTRQRYVEVPSGTTKR